MIQRGTRSAGYGFVSLSSIAAAEKAVAELAGKELDGRALIIEIAKPTEDKDKERSERRSKKRTGGRRGAKAPPGEVTEAEANGQVEKAPEPASPVAEGEETKAKKSKKPVRPFLNRDFFFFCLFFFFLFALLPFDSYDSVPFSSTNLSFALLAQASQQEEGRRRSSYC